MPTYISRLRWTQQGAQNISRSPSRLDAARAAFQRAGVQLKDFYMLMGQYDMVIIVEAPNDEALAKAVLSLGQRAVSALRPPAPLQKRSIARSFQRLADRLSWGRSINTFGALPG